MEIYKNTREHNGTLIVFEGIDGCGKTSVIEEVQKLLLKDLSNRKIVIFSNIEEGSTTGTAIRTMLSKPNDTVSNMRMILLYLSELNYVVEKDKGIMDYLKEGYIVLCSRWFYSTYAYTKVDSVLIDNVIDSSTKTFPLPDLTVYLKVEIETAIERLKNNNKGDFFEKRDKLVKVLNNYQYLITNKLMSQSISIVNDKNFEFNTRMIADLISTVDGLKLLKNNINGETK